MRERERGERKGEWVRERRKVCFSVCVCVCERERERNRERERLSVSAYGGRERRQILAPWNNNVRGKSIKRGNAMCCEQQTDSLFLSFSLGAFERNVNKGSQGFHPYLIYKYLKRYDVDIQ